jgi:hypothetical protein
VAGKRTPVEWCCVTVAVVALMVLLSTAYIHATCNPSGDVPEPGPGAAFDSYCSAVDHAVWPTTAALTLLVAAVAIVARRRTLWVKGSAAIVIAASVITGFVGAVLANS